jgi:hypothetical protein
VPTPPNLTSCNGILLHERNNLNYTVNEALFYTNHNTNRIIPWWALGWQTLRACAIISGSPARRKIIARL